MTPLGFLTMCTRMGMHDAQTALVKYRAEHIRRDKMRAALEELLLNRSAGYLHDEDRDMIREALKGSKR